MTFDKKKWGKLAAIYLLAAYLLAAVVRLLFVQAFTVYANDMFPAYPDNSRLCIEKLSFGCRMPITLLSVPLLHSRIPFVGCRSYVPWLQLPAMRLPGFASLKRGDAIVFNAPAESALPIDKRTYLLSRCVALAGDTLQLDHNILRCNGTVVDIPTATNCYKVVFRSGTAIGSFAPETDYSSILQSDTTTGEAYMVLNSRQLSHMIQRADVAFVANCNAPDRQSRFDPLSPQKNTSHRFVVPAKGQKIILTRANIDYYTSAIRQHEGAKVAIQGGKILINNKPADSYTFTQDYYFCLSDNRSQAYDSRHWGFLPASHIIGKVCSSR